MTTERAPMRFEFSTAVAVPSPDREKAFDFYGQVLGLPVDEMDGERLIDAAPFQMYIDHRQVCEGIVLELKVDDVEAARELLEANGCKVLCWEGAGDMCVIEDPFGVRFNLWQGA